LILQLEHVLDEAVLGQNLFLVPTGREADGVCYEAVST
jgi:hypothetical protein